MAEGKLIVIDGLDGSGKATQTKILEERLRRYGGDVLKLTFPNYDSPSSALVKMYLNGELGENPADVNAYTASAFYAVDRAAGYLQYWKKHYERGALLLADRYTTSNAIYQLSKVEEREKDDFLEWLYDFEYRRLSIPKPDLVIYLDMEPAASQKLMSMRYGGDEKRKDIHERNLTYLHECRKAALYAADRLGWHTITCSNAETVRPAQEIADEIFNKTKGFLNLC